MRIGVYVGSFNPVHDGHIHAAKFLVNNNYVDKVLLLPTPNYWDKNNLASIEDRVNMLKYYEEEDIVVDSIHNNYQYTYQVLDALSNDYDDELYLIIGSDNLEKLHLWKNLDDILKHKIIVLNRGEDISKKLNLYPKSNFIFVEDFKYINISSTEIRNGSREHIKKEVSQYIDENHLYR